ncbi:MAG: YgiQ family radical SAM protein [Phycisphaerales bacterium]|nr:MAG: YgiQ family radical SAM protein [Phycisphaerales bacterium]
MPGDAPAGKTIPLVQLAVPGAYCDTPLPKLPRFLHSASGEPRASARADVPASRHAQGRDEYATGESPRGGDRTGQPGKGHCGARSEGHSAQAKARGTLGTSAQAEACGSLAESVPAHLRRPLPLTAAEVAERGWDEVDVVFVTGDAYVDHPSFAMAILGRVLEADGFRVAILSQPDWHSAEPWRTFGRPRLFFAISAGNMDSMINHYTANKKVRNDDAYSPGGRIGLRPDRATLAYCHRAREAYKGVPVIAGGVEVSLRRVAHYDYWSDTVKRSMVLDSKADLVVYGMGETAILEIARRLRDGEKPRDLRNMRGVAYTLGASETAPTGDGVVTLPTFDEVKADKLKFAEATRLFHVETNPYNARTIVQPHGTQTVVCTPPRLPESQEAMDFFHDLPYTGRAHPSYTEPVPAFQVIRHSVQLMRGCFGGCTFCSITLHQGRIIQSRSKESVVREVAAMKDDPDFKGTVSDIGGPTANMYQMRCIRPEIEAICRRLSCVHPKICPLLGTDHKPLIDVMRETRQQAGIKKVLVASGIRMDLARRDPEYMAELTRHHVGGHLKVAPEHVDGGTLRLMKKTMPEDFEEFSKSFDRLSKDAGKEQYLIPYFISAHPGSDINAMIDLAVFLKRQGYKPEQVQDFIPAPMDIAACMYYTGLDPMTKKKVYVAQHLRDRKLQRALLQFFRPENYFLVRKTLTQAGRQDLIGNGCDCLIPSRPPKAALEARMSQARRDISGGAHRGGGKNRRASRGDSRDGGYRPGRRSSDRRVKKTRMNADERG